MRLKVNGLEFGGNSEYFIEAPLTGFDVPPVRMGSGVWSGKDGGYVSTQFYGSRVIVINGFYKGKNCEHADELRKQLIASLPIRQSLPVYVTTFGGRNLATQTYLQDMKMDIGEGGIFGKFQITLLAPDPLLYEAGDGQDPDSGWIELPVNKLLGGGYVTEYNLPAQWTPGTTPAIANNDGDVVIYPQFKLTGIVQNPIITNLTSGKFVRVNITTTSPTDELIIDMGMRTITLNGGSVLSFRTLDSTWFGLELGENIMQYTSSGSSDVVSGILRWRNGYKGI